MYIMKQLSQLKLYTYLPFYMYIFCENFIWFKTHFVNLSLYQEIKLLPKLFHIYI